MSWLSNLIEQVFGTRCEAASVVTPALDPELVATDEPMPTKQDLVSLGFFDMQLTSDRSDVTRELRGSAGDRFARLRTL